MLTKEKIIIDNADLIVSINGNSPFKRINYKELENGKTTRVVVENSIISFAGVEDSNKNYEEFKKIDAKNMIVAPGSYDIHTHGFSGRRIKCASLQDIKEILKAYLKTGVVGISPTIETSSHEEIKKTLENLVKFSYKDIGARLLPIHLEANYFSQEKKGAQNSRYFKKPKINELRDFMKLAEGYIGIVTLAPELENAYEFIREITKRGIVASFGHSNASYEQALKSIDAGVMLWNHIFNCMGFSYREFSATWAGISDKRVFMEIILDSNHIFPALAELAIREKGIGKTILISDAMYVAGTRLKEFDWDKRKGFIKNNVYGGEMAVLQDGTLCGSILTIDEAIRNLSKMGFKLEEVLQTVSINPMILLNQETKRGSISQGKFADLTLYNYNLGVEKVFVEGSLVYECNKSADAGNIAA